MKTQMTFDEWMKQVDDACYNYVGISVHDLPDVCFRDWYDDGVKPERAASRAIRSAKDDMCF